MLTPPVFALSLKCASGRAIRRIREAHKTNQEEPRSVAGCIGLTTAESSAGLGMCRWCARFHLIIALKSCHKS